MIRRYIDGIMFTLQHDDYFSKFLMIEFERRQGHTKVILSISNGFIDVRIIRSYREHNKMITEDKTISYYDTRVYLQLSRAFNVLAYKLTRGSLR